MLNNVVVAVIRNGLIDKCMLFSAYKFDAVHAAEKEFLMLAESYGCPLKDLDDALSDGYYSMSETDSVCMTYPDAVMHEEVKHVTFVIPQRFNEQFLQEFPWCRKDMNKKIGVGRMIQYSGDYRESIITALFDYPHAKNIQVSYIGEPVIIKTALG